MKTELIKLKGLSDAEIESALAKALAILDASGLVAFPTETVYGLAARVDKSEALNRLNQIKQRPSDKPFTLHIGEKSHLPRYVPGLSLLDRQFLRKAWPGPLTVIFELDPSQQQQIQRNLSDQLIKSLYYNSSIGIRLPDHTFARRLLAGAEAPIVAPSANLAGEPAPTSGEDVLDNLDGQIDLVLDDGETKYAKSSTIVRLKGDTLKFEREGLLDAATLKRMRQVCILFVCTGNTCRSPMAEGICRAMLAEKLECKLDQLQEKGYKVISAGVMAFDGAPATTPALQVSREAEIDLSGHQARMLTVGLLNEADFILVMQRSHYRAVLDISAQAEARTTLLADNSEIADPIGMPIEIYRKCAQSISAGLEQQMKNGLLACRL